MTTTEFSNEFDIAYNGIASNDAPGLDLYEKSVYLTKAQLEIIKNYFNSKGNKYREGFESSSKRRVDLNELIKYKHSFDKTNDTVNTDNGISSDSQFFKIPFDLFLIIQEQAVLTSTTDSCVNNTTVDVKPVTHDEYNIQKDNPFKKPDKNIVWRLDYSSIDGINKYVELISSYVLESYKLRYIKYPDPIILTNLQTAFPDETLTIDGEFNEATCKLSESIHREILDRAVELALSDYKQGNLAAKVQLNSRNE